MQEKNSHRSQAGVAFGALEWAGRQRLDAQRDLGQLRRVPDAAVHEDAAPAVVGRHLRQAVAQQGAAQAAAAIHDQHAPLALPMAGRQTGVQQERQMPLAILLLFPAQQRSPLPSLQGSQRLPRAVQAGPRSALALLSSSCRTSTLLSKQRTVTACTRGGHSPFAEAHVQKKKAMLACAERRMHPHLPAEL